MYIDKHINNSNWGEIKDILPQITMIKSLYLCEMNLIELPKMEHIDILKTFDCSYNQISSLKNSPTVHGDFYCHNNQITSFEHCTFVGRCLYCGNNQITSFKDCPYISGRYFSCHDNPFNSIKYAPDYSGEFFSGIQSFDTIYEYSRRNKVTLLEAQIKLYNDNYRCILDDMDRLPDLVAYIRLKKLNSLL